MIRSTDIVENPDRPNIKLFVQKVKSSALLSSTFSWLIEAVRLEKQQTGRVLVFCPSIKLCGELYTLFRMELDESTLSHVDMYHSCTTENVKEKIRNDMEQSNGNIRILIATSAAGMGVNYKSVNQIVHWGPPKDMDSFVQQLGRAGREGDQGYQLLLYHGRQFHSVDSEMKVYVQNTTFCRRGIILQAYNSEPNQHRIRHLCCDICAKECACGELTCKTFEHEYVTYENIADQADSDSSMEQDSEDTLSLSDSD